MRFGIASALLCWITVLQAEHSIDLETCKSDDGNCETFSFHRTTQNISNVNKSVEAKKLDALKDLELIENRLVFEQSHTQENGNFRLTT